MNARETILLKLKGSLSGHNDAGFIAQRDVFTEESGKSPLHRYTELALAEGTTVSKADSWTDVPTAVAHYLQVSGLPARIVINSRQPLSEAGWREAGIATSTSPLNADGDILLGDCYGAVAESGAIVISSNSMAIVNNFLAETHIILLRTENVLPSLAELWQSLRVDAGDGPMPREFCLVTGPSRTADLGVPAKMGAHGPARVHVVIVDA